MKRNTRASFNHQLTFAKIRPKRRGRWLFSALVFALIGGALTYTLWEEFQPPPAIAPPAATTELPAAAAAPAPEAPPVVKVDIAYVVRPSDTLGEIFSQLNLDVTELPAILNVPAVRARFKPLHPGDKLTLALENGVLHGIERRISETEILSIARGDGGFAAKVIETPVVIKTAQVRGTINSSLFVAGRAAGLSPEMVQHIANEIFGWHIDFARDVRAGDRFNVVYEQKYRDEEYLGDGHIVAAEFVNDGENYRAVRYTSSDGKIDGYFTPDGRSVRRQFLRAPIDVTRVSPSANAAHRQPLLNTLDEHQGIDYPAPVGTAIKAAGDGRIKFVGANGAYGNTVTIDHDGAISTRYAHMSAFVSGLQTKQRVKQGETIGYVGSSGAATAPHLHYEYRVNGAHTDPSEPAGGATIPAEYLADFQSKLAALLARLEQPGDALVTASLTR